MAFFNLHISRDYKVSVVSFQRTVLSST